MPAATIPELLGQIGELRLVPAFLIQLDRQIDKSGVVGQTGKLGAFKSPAYWRGVDTIKDVTEVASEMQRRLLSLFREG